MSHNIFNSLERLASAKDGVAKEFDEACTALRQRLRRDTEVILHMRQASFAKLFDPRYANSSFQNKVLAYMLYKCGGFVPTCVSEKEIIDQCPTSAPVRQI
jgi:hypothetical protein